MCYNFPMLNPLEFRAILAVGVTIVRKLKDNPWGDRSFAVRDPDGIRVWVYQITDPALAQNLGI